MEIKFYDKIHLTDFKSVYFVGIGGIGMSALARYFNSSDYSVGGYDKTSSPLTDELINEGCLIHFEDLDYQIPSQFKNKATTLVIITPAIPKDHGELNYFIDNGFTILKRSEVLGLITKSLKGLCVAGTHGKTTTSTMLAHILNSSTWKCNAFLGGISTNFNSNLLVNKQSELAVIEADEFDRSFLQLSPFSSIITSTDPDHLDIYGTDSEFQEGFQIYANKISENGFLILKEGLKLHCSASTKTYAVNSETADYKGRNLRVENGRFLMDVYFETSCWKNMELGVPGIHNAENALACISLLHELGLDEMQIRFGLKSFLGVKRRFEYIVRNDKKVYIDDYAHHPKEIKALVDSVRLMYPAKKITGIFQPHLFSRTRDFMDDFALELGKLDKIILLPIYPARELPISGITSELLLSKINNPNKYLFTPEDAIRYVKTHELEVLLSIGAGDIDRIVPNIESILTNSLQK